LDTGASAFVEEAGHGSCWTAAFFQKFTMKIYVFLLLLAAFTCGLAQGEDSEPEELQVETLVSGMCVTQS